MAEIVGPVRCQVHPGSVRPQNGTASGDPAAARWQLSLPVLWRQTSSVVGDRGRPPCPALPPSFSASTRVQVWKASQCCPGLERQQPQAYAASAFKEEAECCLSRLVARLLQPPVNSLGGLGCC